MKAAVLTSLNKDLEIIDLKIPELKRGQISLHDVFLVHGSEPNTSDKSRRGMTMRFMPTTSLFDHKLAKEQFNNMRVPDHSERKIYHMRGVDRCGQNRLIYA